MEKDFATWHILKMHLNDTPTTIPIGYKEREVWWLCLGHNIGFEEDGKGKNFNRPVLVIKGFNRRFFWGVPLSTTEKRGQFYYPFMVNNVVSVALLSQLRAFDAKRLMNKMGMMPARDYVELKSRLIDLLS